MNRSSLLKEETRKSTPKEAYYNFLNAVVGIGMTAIPFASVETGQLWAILLMFIVMFCCYQSTMFLLEVADSLDEEHEDQTQLLLNDVTKYTLGGYWPNVLDTLMVLNQSALCIGYLVFVTSFIRIELEAVGVFTSDYVPFLMTLIPILPLTLVNNIHFFHQVSAIGMGFALLGILLTIAYGWKMVFNYDVPVYFIDPVRITSNRQSIDKESFVFIGIGINCFEGIPTVLPIRDSMQDKQQFKPVFIKVMVTLFIIVIIMQQLLVMSYGQGIERMFVFSIQDPMWQFLASMTYCVSILLTYPMIVFPALQILETMLITTGQGKPTLWIRSKAQLLIRMVLTLVLFGVAYVVPNFAAFLNLVGSVLGTMLQYMFPCLIHFFYFQERSKPTDLVAYVLIVGFSSVTMVLGCWESIREM